MRRAVARIGSALRWLMSPAATVGGQAVIEGVMMRGVRHWTVAVRRPDGDIALVEEEITPWAARRRWLRLPILRGVVALGETLVIGMKSLAVSASEAAGEDEETGEKQLTKFAVGVTLTVSLSIAIALFFLLPLFITKTVFDFDSGLAFWATEAAIELVIFVLYLWALSFMRDLRRVFQFHAAEHMAIHAHEAGEPVTAATAARYSRFHVRCGTSFLLIVMVVAIIVFGAIGKHALWIMVLSRIVCIPLIAGLSYEVIRWAGKNPDAGYVRAIMAPGLWLQYLTTREPEAEHLEVAAVALNRVLELEANPPNWAGEVEVEVMA